MLIMKCPACQYRDTSVVDSRMFGEGSAIRRRRECARCDYRFSTVEEAEILNLMVIKRDGSREPYNRSKLETGLRKAFEKRAVKETVFKRLIGQLERDIQLRGQDEIASGQIGEIVMKRLLRLDQVAYIRFASVCRQFQDVQSFRRELNRLSSKVKS